MTVAFRPRRRSVALLSAERERQFEGVVDAAKLFSHDIVGAHAYRDAHRREGLPAGERALRVAVLDEAIGVVVKYDLFDTPPHFHRDAVDWLAANDPGQPFSFVSICEALALTPECVRRAVAGELENRRLKRTPQTTAQRAWEWAQRQLRDWTTDRLARAVGVSSSSARGFVSQWLISGAVAVVERRTGRHGFAIYRVVRREVG